MELVSYGYDNRAIAEHFQTLTQAVKNMVRNILLKLGADNRAHAVSVCFRNGWLPGSADHGTLAESGLGPSSGETGSGTGCTRRWRSASVVESVCDSCSLTIARAFRLSDLALSESNHRCQRHERRHNVRVIAQGEGLRGGPKH